MFSESRFWSFLDIMLTFQAVKADAIPGGKANGLLQKLVNLWANNNGYSKSEASSLCRSRLLLALLRGMARQLVRGFPRPFGSCAFDIWLRFARSKIRLNE